MIHTLAASQPPITQGAGAAPQGPTQVMQTYHDTLSHLPGVSDVSLQEDGLHLKTRSARDSKFLDALLEDSISGVVVHFDAPAPAAVIKKPAGSAKSQVHHPRPSQPRPVLSASEKAVQRFGKALRAIPHITDVTANPTGSQQVVIHVDHATSVQFLDDLLEDKLNGVIVQFVPDAA